MYSAHVLATGTILNKKYRIESVLGEGGFGIVYSAYDVLINEKVAIKEFFPSTLGTRTVTEMKDYSISVLSPEHKPSYEKSLNRFREEASKLAKFNKESGIVSVKNFFEENNTGYIVMEFVEGITLEQYLNDKGGKISYRDAISLLVPIIDSLNNVHKEGIIHRDISPDNIMITNAGKAVLIDFGASRAFESEEEQAFTVMVKNGYAPIEQYSLMSEQTPATDVYSVSAVLYRMITGQKPADSGERIIKGVEDEKIAGCPVSIEKAINYGMKIDAKDRCPDMLTLKKLLLKKQRTYFGLFAAAVTVAVIIGTGMVYGKLPTESVTVFQPVIDQDGNMGVTDADAPTEESTSDNDTDMHYMYAVSYSDIYIRVEGRLLISDHCKTGDRYAVKSIEGDYVCVELSEYQTGYISIGDLVEEEDFNAWISYYYRVIEAADAVRTEYESQNLPGVFRDFDGDGVKELIVPLITGSKGLWYADATSVFELTDETPYCYEIFQQGKTVIFCASFKKANKEETKYYCVNNGIASEIKCDGYDLSFEKGWMTASDKQSNCINDVEYIDNRGNEKTLKLISTNYWPIVVVNGQIGECASAEISVEDFMNIESSEPLIESIRDYLFHALRNNSMQGIIRTTKGDVPITYFTEPSDFTIDSVFYNEQGFFIINILADIADVNVEYYGAEGYTPVGYYHVDKVYAHVIAQYEGDGTLHSFSNLEELENTIFLGKRMAVSNKWPVLMNSDFSNYRGRKKQ